MTTANICILYSASYRGLLPLKIISTLPNGIFPIHGKSQCTSPFAKYVKTKALHQMVSFQVQTLVYFMQAVLTAIFKIYHCLPYPTTITTLVGEFKLPTSCGPFYHPPPYPSSFHPQSRKLYFPSGVQLFVSKLPVPIFYLTSLLRVAKFLIVNDWWWKV